MLRGAAALMISVGWFIDEYPAEGQDETMELTFKFSGVFIVDFI